MYTRQGGVGFGASGRGERLLCEGRLVWGGGCVGAVIRVSAGDPSWRDGCCFCGDGGTIAGADSWSPSTTCTVGRSCRRVPEWWGSPPPGDL